MPTDPPARETDLGAMPLAARAAWPVAVLCAAWSAAFNWDEPRGTLLGVPLVLVGVGLLVRHVRAGVALVMLAGLVTYLAGASWGNVDSVLPLAVALFALGRVSAQGWHGCVAVLGAAVLSSLRDGLTLEKLVITAGLYGAMWAFGRVVRRRAFEAFAAVARAERLAGQDPEAAAARWAVEERSRLAEEALFALRTAVVGMRSTARQAVTHLDPDVVRAVHERGSVAVDELRSLLGLLRETEAPPPTERSSAERGRRRVPSLLPVPAWCLVLTAGTLPFVVTPPSRPELLLPGAAAYALVTWRVGVRPARATVLALVPLVVSGVWLSTSYGSRGTAFVLLVFGTALLAGLAWGERDRIFRAAEQREHHLRTRLTEATSAAVRTERLRLARDLHDVAGHAVGAMVLQAGAAAALRARDPEASRAALRTVDAIGEGALHEVDEMLATLSSGEPGGAVRAHAEPGRLRTALEDFLERMRADGMRVHARLGTLPDSPELAATTYRVVHEAVSNAARHAPGARVEVVADLEDDGYVVRVSDDGTGVSEQRGTGYGLAGLRERVSACEGTFQAGPGPGARPGFLVEARLPATASRKVAP